MKTAVETYRGKYCVSYFNKETQRWEYVNDSIREYKFLAKRLAKKISLKGLPKITNENVPIAIFENGKEL